MAPVNKAAVLVAEKQRPLEIREVPYTSPSDGELVVRVKAIALNPTDWFLQALAHIPVQYPVILGEDIAGEVVEVGPGMTRFAVGDRVVGMTLGVVTGRNSEGAFQDYVAVTQNLTSQIPASLSFEDACTLPLCLSVATAGLFQEDYLALPLPTVDPKPTGQTLILAVASGYKVITICSPRNFDLVKKISASAGLDYKSESITEDLLAVLKGKEVAGSFDAITIDGAFEVQAEVLRRCGGGKFIPTARPRADAAELDGGIRTKFITTYDLKDNGVGKAIWEDFLPHALEQGKYYIAPEKYVFGKGLEAVQGAFDYMMKGISAQKVVVSLE